MKNQLCPFCNKPTEGSGIRVENEMLAHSSCYYRANPPRVAHNLYQVARGCGDPVLAADVISEIVPKELADNIVEEFNKRLMKDWLRRCE